MNFRVDIVGLSTDTKPTENVADSTTFYCVDNQKLYVYYKGTWYDQDPAEETQEESEEE